MAASVTSRRKRRNRDSYSPPYIAQRPMASNQNQGFYQVENAIVLAINGDSHNHILVGEDDVCVKKDPPDEQHHEVQSEEVQAALLGSTMRTQGDICHHGNDVQKENDVTEIGVGKILPQNHFVVGPSRLADAPHKTAGGHQGPKCAGLAFIAK